MKVILFLILVSSAFGKSITYKVNDVEYEGYLVKGNNKLPLIFLVHDWDGLTDYEIKRSEMLHRFGYNVFAVDLFGKGKRPTEMDVKKEMTGALYKDRNKMRSLLNGAIETAKSLKLNTAKSVAVGYCFGGAAVLELARSGSDLKAFVSFHGGLETPSDQNYKNTKGKILILHGTADDSVTMEHFAKLATELEGAKISHEMITYSGSPHAFTVFGSERYRKDADEKSWDRFIRFLREVFKA